MAKSFQITAQLQLQAPTNTRNVVNTIRQQLRGVSVSVDVNANIKSINNVNKALNSVNRTARQTEKSVYDFGKSLGSTIRRVGAFAIASSTFLALSRAINSSVSEAIEFEREILKISQGTGQAVYELKDLTKEITALSTNLGVSSKELALAARTLIQAGIEGQKTDKILKTLAETELAATFDTIIETTEGVIAVLAQFQKEAKEAGGDAAFIEKAFSAISDVAKKFAVESADLITVIRRTGGAFETAGGSLNELIALFTSVRATTRESAETIATGFRTIFTRIQRVDTISKLREFGIELQDLEGKFIGPYESVRRLSQALSQLDPKDFRFNLIVEELGGFRQIGKVIPLVKQFELAQRALNVAENSGASLAKDAATAQKGLGVQIQKVGEEFEALVRKFSDTSTFKGIAGSAIKLASALIKVAEALEPILPLIATLGAAKLGATLIPSLGSLTGIRRRNQGGRIHAFASGGLVPGSGNRDTVPAMLTPGEFVIKKSSVNKIGADSLASANKFADGGPVVPFKKVARTLGKNETELRKLKDSNPAEYTKLEQLAAEKLGVKVKSESKESSIAPVTASTPSSRMGIQLKNGTIGALFLNPPKGEDLDSMIDTKIPITNLSVLKSLNKSPTDRDRLIKKTILGGTIEQQEKMLGRQVQSKIRNTREIKLDDNIRSRTEKFISEDNNVGLGGKRTEVGLRGQVGGFFVGNRDLQKDAIINDTINKATRKGMEDAIAEASRVTRTLITGIDPINANENKVYNEAISNLFVKGGGAIETIEGYIFEGLVAAITNANVAGTTKAFDFQNFSGASKVRLSQLFANDKVLQLQKADAKRSFRPGLLTDYNTDGSIVRKIAREINQKGIDPSTESIARFAKGGGVGTDTVPALLTPGEFVINKKSAKAIGSGTLNRMNKVGKFAKGGGVGNIPQNFQEIKDNPLYFNIFKGIYKDNLQSLKPAGLSNNEIFDASISDTANTVKLLNKTLEKNLKIITSEEKARRKAYEGIVKSNDQLTIVENSAQQLAFFGSILASTASQLGLFDKATANAITSATFTSSAILGLGSTLIEPINATVSSQLKTIEQANDAIQNQTNGLTKTSKGAIPATIAGLNNLSTVLTGAVIGFSIGAGVVEYFASSLRHAAETAQKLSDEQEKQLQSGKSVDKQQFTSTRANFVNNSISSKNTTRNGLIGAVGGAAAGAVTGAVIGSFIPVPVVSTIVGGILGGVIGGLAGKSLAGGAEPQVIQSNKLLAESQYNSITSLNAFKNSIETIKSINLSAADTLDQTNKVFIELERATFRSIDVANIGINTETQYGDLTEETIESIKKEKAALDAMVKTFADSEGIIRDSLRGQVQSRLKNGENISTILSDTKAKESLRQLSISLFAQGKTAEQVGKIMGALGNNLIDEVIQVKSLELAQIRQAIIINLLTQAANDAAVGLKGLSDITDDFDIVSSRIGNVISTLSGDVTSGISKGAKGRSGLVLGRIGTRAEGRINQSETVTRLLQPALQKLRGLTLGDTLNIDKFVNDLFKGANVGNDLTKLVKEAIYSVEGAFNTENIDKILNQVEKFAEKDRDLREKSIEFENKYISEQVKLNAALIEAKGARITAEQGIIEGVYRNFERLETLANRPIFSSALKQDLRNRSAAIGLGSDAGLVNNIGGLSRRASQLQAQIVNNSRVNRNGLSTEQINRLNKGSQEFQDQLNRVINRLKELSNQSERASDTLSEIGRERDKREAVQGVIKDFAFADNAGRGEIDRSFAALTRVLKTGNLDSIPDSLRGSVGQLLDQFKDIKLVNNLTGENISKLIQISELDKAIKRSGGIGLSEGQRKEIFDSTSKEDKLILDLRTIATEENVAQKELINFQKANEAIVISEQRNTFKAFEDALKKIQTEFIQALSATQKAIQVLAEQKIKPVDTTKEGQLENEIKNLTGQKGGNIQAITDAFINGAKSFASMEASIVKFDTIIANSANGFNKIVTDFNGSVLRFDEAIKRLESNDPRRNSSGNNAISRARGGLIYRAGGGSIFKPRGTDTVPAMLTPGEFVIKKGAVDKVGTGVLAAINAGYFAKGGKATDKDTLLQKMLEEEKRGPIAEKYRKVKEKFDEIAKNSKIGNLTGKAKERAIQNMIEEEAAKRNVEKEKKRAADNAADRKKYLESQPAKREIKVNNVKAFDLAGNPVKKKDYNYIDPSKKRTFAGNGKGVVAFGSGYGITSGLAKDDPNPYKGPSSSSVSSTSQSPYAGFTAEQKEVAIEQRLKEIENERLNRQDDLNKGLVKPTDLKLNRSKGILSIPKSAGSSYTDKDREAFETRRQENKAKREEQERMKNQAIAKRQAILNKKNSFYYESQLEKKKRYNDIKSFKGDEDIKRVNRNTLKFKSKIPLFEQYPNEALTRDGRIRARKIRRQERINSRKSGFKYRSSFGLPEAPNPYGIQLPKRFNMGGGVDTVPAMLTPGEFVINRGAVQKYGVNFMSSLNNGKVPGYALGGVVSSPKGRQDTSGGTSFDNVINSFSKFTTSLQKVAEQFGNLHITHTVNVDGQLNIGGAIGENIASQITQSIANFVVDTVNTQLEKQAKNFRAT